MRVPGREEVGAVSGELCPARALEVLARGEAEERCAVAPGVEHEQCVRCGMTGEGEEDGAGSGYDAGGDGVVAGLRVQGVDKGGGGEEDDVCVGDEL